MNTLEQKAKILKRVESGKYAMKKKYEDIFPTLGAFDVDNKDYTNLIQIVKLCKTYFDKHEIKEFDINKLPARLKEMLVKNYYRALNQRIESLSEESKVFFYGGYAC